MIDDEVIWQDEVWSEYTEWILERKISIIEKNSKTYKRHIKKWTFKRNWKT